MYYNYCQSMHCIDLIPIALRKAIITYNFGHSECNRVKSNAKFHFHSLYTYKMMAQNRVNFVPSVT